MRHGRPTDDELKHLFVNELGSVLTGRGLRSCTVFDDDTQNALWEICKAHPHIPLELVDAARQAFAGQLDGSNAARWNADLDRWFATRDDRRRPPGAPSTTPGTPPSG